MTDHKQICEALRRMQIHRSKVLAAADLIEQQAARIAELENEIAELENESAQHVVTATMITISGRQYDEIIAATLAS